MTTTSGVTKCFCFVQNNNHQQIIDAKILFWDLCFQGRLVLSTIPFT